MLRAYMHGYFIDVRLYEQARVLTQPLAFENYKKRKVCSKKFFLIIIFFSCKSILIMNVRPNLLAKIS